MTFLLITENPLMSIALRSVLSVESPELDIHICDTLQNAVELSTAREFQTMLLDITVEDGTRLALLEEFKKQNPQVGIVVNLGDEPEYTYAYIQIGVNAVISKKTLPVEIIKAYNAAVSSSRFVSAELYQMVLSDISNAGAILTKKEHIVTAMILKNKSRADIAAFLGVNQQSISNYKRKIFAKLGVTNVRDLNIKYGRMVIASHQKNKANAIEK